MRGNSENDYAIKGVIVAVIWGLASIYISQLKKGSKAGKMGCAKHLARILYQGDKKGCGSWHNVYAVKAIMI